MYNDIAYLTKKVKTGTFNEYGDEIYTYDQTKVFVKVKSVSRSEFYAAQNAGYDPQIIFEIADYYDYNNQPFIEYNGAMYKVVRTYRTNISMEIVCQHDDLL